MKGKVKKCPRPGWGRAGVLAPLLVAAGIVLAPVVAHAQQSSVPSLRPDGGRGAETASLSPLPDQGASTVTLPQPLGLADADRYRQIFDLQDAGKFRDAEVLLGWVSDHRLVGHVLAQRYLSAGYRASYGELAAWLQQYADHPEAPHLYALAVRRRPAGAPAPRRPEVDLFQSGTTDDSSIGGNPYWRAGLARWRTHDLAGAAAAFESLAKSLLDSPWDKATAAYWAARAHLKNRQPDQVSTWLGVAAQYPRTFYGQLARRALGLDPSFDWSAKPLTSAGVRAVAANGTGQRVLALLQVGEMGLAEDEMRGLLRGASPDLASGLLGIAQSYQLPSIALGLGVMAEQRTNVRADVDLYPLFHWKPKGGFVIDRALVFALARQESGFDTTARSGAGATGLMQIMPDTARALGGRATDLHDPATNLALGQEYLRRLLADPSINGDLILMSVAYNAGPSILVKWRASYSSDDPLLFLESLPNRETRNFVERVMANYWIYQDRLGQDTPSLDKVAAGGWPVYQAQDGFAAVDNADANAGTGGGLFNDEMLGGGSN
jgi:soluble lytic murein transglycosylase-like protein